MNALSGALAVGAGWLVRELVGLKLRDAAARSGRVAYLSERSELLERWKDSSGEVVETFYVEREGKVGPEVVFAKYAGRIHNDTGTNLVLHSPQVVMWALDGPRIKHVNPEMAVNGEPSTVAEVPAHGTCRIALTLVLPVEGLPSTFYETFPTLSFTLPTGRFIEFPLGGVSVWRAQRAIAWDAKKRRVVVGGTREWAKAISRLNVPVGRIRDASV